MKAASINDNVLLPSRKMRAEAERRATIPAGFKRCKDCGEIKPLTSFPVQHSAGDGRRSRCHRCKRDRTLSRPYRERSKAPVEDHHQQALTDDLAAIANEPHIGETPELRAYEQRLQIFAMHQRHHSYEFIAESFGVSPDWVRRLIARILA